MQVIYMFYSERDTEGPGTTIIEHEKHPCSEDAHAILGVFMTIPCWTYCARVTAEYIFKLPDGRWGFFFHQHDEHQGSYEFWPVLVGVKKEYGDNTRCFSEEELAKVTKIQFPNAPDGVDMPDHEWQPIFAKRTALALGSFEAISDDWGKEG